MKIKINDKIIKIKKYTKFKDRLLGLMFQKKKLEYGICFPKCNSIHTFFMKQEINVIITDKNLKIIKKYINLKPWKIIFPVKKAYYIFEFTNNITINNIEKIEILP